MAKITESELLIVLRARDLLTGPTREAGQEMDKATKEAVELLNSIERLNAAEVAAAKSAAVLAAEFPAVTASLNGFLEASRAAGAAISATQLGAIASVKQLSQEFERAAVAQNELLSGTAIGSGIGAFAEQSKATFDSIKNVQAGAITSIEDLSRAFNLPIAKAQELKAAIEAERAAPIRQLEQALESLGVSGARAAEVIREIRPPKISETQINEVRVALEGLNLTAGETEAALQRLGLVQPIKPARIAEAEAALQRLGVTAERSATAISGAFSERVKIDPQRIKQATAALSELGLTGKEIQGVLQSVGAEAERTFIQRFQGALAPLGKLLSSTAVQLIGLFVVINKFSEGVRSALAFGKAMAQVATIVDKTSGELAGLRQEVLGIARDFGANELDVAKGLYFTLSSGITDTKDALLLLRRATELSTSGFADTEDVIDLLTSTINAYGLTVKDAARLNDIFFATVKSGKAEIPELAHNLGSVLPIAAQMGVKIEEVNAAVAALTLGGRNADEAVTGLRQVLINLLNPTADAQAILKGLDEQFGIFGGKTLPDILRQGGSLFEVFTKIREAVGGNNEALREILPDARAFTVAAALTGKQYETLRRVLDEVTNSVGANQSALDRALQDPAKRFDILLTGIRQGFLEVGRSFVASLIPASETLGTVQEQADAIRQAILGWGEALSTVTGSLGIFAKGILTIQSAAIDLQQGAISGFKAKTEEAARIAGEQVGKLEAAQRSIQKLLGFTGQNEIEAEFLKARDEAQNLNIGIKELRDRITQLGSTNKLDLFGDIDRQISDAQKKLSDALASPDANIFESETGNIRSLTQEVGRLKAVRDSIPKGPVLDFSTVKANDAPAQIALLEEGIRKLVENKAELEAFIGAFPELQKEFSVVPKALNDVIIPAGNATDAIGAMGDEVDIVGAKLKQFQLDASRLDVGRSIALMAAQANEALAGIGTSFGARVARLKTQAVELGNEFERAKAEIDVKRTQGEFGVKGSKEATEQEKAYRAAIEARFHAQQSAIDAEIRGLATLKRARVLLAQIVDRPTQFISPSTFLAVSTAVQAASQAALSFADAQKLVQDVQSQVNTELVAGIDIQLRQIDATEDLARAQFRLGAITEGQLSKIEEFSAALRRQATDVSGLEKALNDAISPQVETERIDLSERLNDIKNQMRAALVAADQPGEFIVDSLTNASEKIDEALGRFDDILERRTKKSKDDVLALSIGSLREAAGAFAGIQNEIHGRINDLAIESFNTGVSTEDFKAMADRIRAAGEKELSNILVNISLTPQLDIETEALTAQLATKLQPFKADMKDLFADFDAKDINADEFVSRFDKIREAMRRLKDQVFDTADAFKRGFRGAFDDFRREINLFNEGKSIFSSLQSGFEDFFVSFASGAKSGKEAFKAFASSVLSDILRLIAKRAFLNLLLWLGLGSLFGGGAAAHSIGGADFGAGERGGVVRGQVQQIASTPGLSQSLGGLNKIPKIGGAKHFEKGGVMHGEMQRAVSISKALNIPVRKYEFGGVANDEQVAVFGKHGSTKAEAFVPLPGPNRGIPVEFKNLPQASERRRDSSGEVSVTAQTSVVIHNYDPRVSPKEIQEQVDNAILSALAGRNRTIIDAVSGVRRR